MVLCLKSNDPLYLKGFAFIGYLHASQKSIKKIVIEIDYTSVINTVPNAPYNLLHINWKVKMHSSKTNFFKGYPWSKSGYIMVPWEE